VGRPVQEVRKLKLEHDAQKKNYELFWEEIKDLPDEERPERHGDPPLHKSPEPEPGLNYKLMSLDRLLGSYCNKFIKFWGYVEPCVQC
jgi:hypothetical protein